MRRAYVVTVEALSHERRCAEVLTQTRLLVSQIEGADPAAPVPTCPGWQLVHLLRHVGRTHRWAERVVATRTREPVSDAPVNDVSPADEDPAQDGFGDWLLAGAARLADELRRAGESVPLWSPGPESTSAFWARRMAHETLIHRYDAARAAAVEFTAQPDVAADALDEYLGFGTLPELLEPEQRETARTPLLVPDRTLLFQPTDADGGSGASTRWLVDLTGRTGRRIVLRRLPPHDRRPMTTVPRAAVTLRGPLTDLLLLLYGRRDLDTAALDISGDTGPLESWLERSRFWLR